MTAVPTAQRARLRSRTRPLDDPGDLLARLGADGFCWLSGPGVRGVPAGPGVRGVPAGAVSFVTAGVAARIPVPPGADRFSVVADEVAALLGDIAVSDDVDLPGTGPLAVGALPFDDAAPGELVVPALVIGRHPSGAAWITEVAPAQEPSGIWSPGPAVEEQRPAAPLTVLEEPGRQAWTGAVERILSAIAAGIVRKVVLARQVVLEADAPFDRTGILARLHRAHPSCYTYAAGSFVGATPELLVRRAGGEVTSCPMAGTVARGDDARDDERLVAALTASGKDAAEHGLLVEAVMAALSPVCVVPPRATPPEVVRLANVSHLATRVQGELVEPWPSVLALVGRLHPTPAVGGTPRPAALAAIAALEVFDRGRYAGPVGWIDRHGDGEWAVALRGAELDGRRARLMAGAGIVAGSDPAAEWAETEAKLAAMRSAIGA